VAIVFYNGSASASSKPFQWKQLKGVTMQSSQLNNENPSVPSLRENPCFTTDPTIAALEVIADDGSSYLLPYAQFLYAERTPNPAPEKEPDAPPEKLLIRFIWADVVILGSGLKTLERSIQRFELKFVKAADRRLAATLNTHVAAISVTLNKEVA
jgi:hypothetical protein